MCSRLKSMMGVLAGAGFFAAMIFLSHGPAYAQKAAPAPVQKAAPAPVAARARRTSALKEIEGPLTWKNKYKIAVVYKQDAGSENEMLLPLDKKVIVEHKQDLSQISAGDTVRVQYEEVVEDGPEGKKTISRVAKIVTFIARAPQKPPAAQAPSSQTLSSYGEDEH